MKIYFVTLLCVLLTLQSVHTQDETGCTPAALLDCNGKLLRVKARITTYEQACRAVSHYAQCVGPVCYSESGVENAMYAALDIKGLTCGSSRLTNSIAVMLTLITVCQYFYYTEL